MHRIDTPGATGDNKFTAGNPVTGVPATQVGADWLNAVQGELVNTVEGLGLTLVKNDNHQLLKALQAMVNVLPGYSVMQVMGSNLNTYVGVRDSAASKITTGRIYAPFGGFILPSAGAPGARTAWLSQKFHLAQARTITFDIVTHDDDVSITAVSSNGATIYTPILKTGDTETPSTGSIALPAGNFYLNITISNAGGSEMHLTLGDWYDVDTSFGWPV